MANGSPSKIVFHTDFRPGEEPKKAAPQSAGKSRKRKAAGEKGVRWACVPHPGNLRRARQRPGMGERLLRNSAIACAVLLGILTLGNIDQPWANRAVGAVRQALTMRVSLDDSFGGMRFVQNLVPESALVFFNLSGESELKRPTSGDIAHEWSSAQPWLLFSCAAGDSVLAAADGTVTAVSALSGGDYGLLIDHGEGLESVYAYLDGAKVAPGEQVSRGQVIGLCGESSGTLYYELRQGGEPVDPTARMNP